MGTQQIYNNSDFISQHLPNDNKLPAMIIQPNSQHHQQQIHHNQQHLQPNSQQVRKLIFERL